MSGETNILATAWYNSYDFGHDINGNPTAHFELWANGDKVKETKRRQQIGYSGCKHAVAEYELQLWAKKTFPKQEVWLFPDPAFHAWMFTAQQPAVPYLDRRGRHNTRTYLVLNCHADEWNASEEGIRRRVYGLAKPYIQQRVDNALDSALEATRNIAASSIRTLSEKGVTYAGTITGLHLVDINLEAAWKKALEETKYHATK